jgi:putative transposase
LSGHLTSQKIVRNVGLPLVNQFLAQGYALVRILSALKIKSSTYYNWRHWQPIRQAKRRESLKPYILDIWQTFKFNGDRRIAAYSQLTDDCPKISEYMTLKLMRELGIKSRMQKGYCKPKKVVTVDQKPNLIKHLYDLSGVWQTDITYIQLINHRGVYLATVLDPEKRKVKSVKSHTMTAELATSALQMALDKHRKPLIIHSDMGVTIHEC